MTRQLSHTDSVNATTFDPDDYGEKQKDLIAIEAYIRASGYWKLTNLVAGKMISVSPRTVVRVKEGTWKGSLNQDQQMRVSALIGLYKALHLYFGNDDLADEWIALPNAGPLFSGRKPVDAMIEEGLPMIMKTRNYVDALRDGV